MNAACTPGSSKGGLVVHVMGSPIAFSATLRAPWTPESGRDPTVCMRPW